MNAEEPGAYPEPGRVLVHLSDTHFVASPAGLYDAVDTDSLLERAVTQLERMGTDVDALVVTGDVADRAEPEAYARIRKILEAAARRLGTELVWVMGNHDGRDALRHELLGQPASDAPIDSVRILGGFRLVTLDTSVPGFHHGDIAPEQFDWLRDVLSQPAPEGTVLAMHHPPLPTPVKLLRILELKHQDELASVIAGSDVRAILAGHLHYPTTGLFAGVPVFAAGAVSYTIDVSAPARELSGVDGGQTFQLISIYPDRVVCAVAPIGNSRQVARFDADYLDRLEALGPLERFDAFSRMPPPTTPERAAHQAPSTRPGTIS
jgi:3',5'-cyclic AMP phosphodiesterase CpdA